MFLKNPSNLISGPLEKRQMDPWDSIFRFFFNHRILVGLNESLIVDTLVRRCLYFNFHLNFTSSLYRNMVTQTLEFLSIFFLFVSLVVHFINSFLINKHVTLIIIFFGLNLPDRKLDLLAIELHCMPCKIETILSSMALQDLTSINKLHTL